MKRTFAILSATVVTATSAFAQTDIAEIDWNNDSFVSFSELAIAYPGVSRSDFRSIDTNGDNRIDSTELYELEAQNILARHEDTGRQIRIAVDANRDGFVSYDELAAVFPGVTELDFASIDVNGDNRIDNWEYYDLEAQTILARYEMNGDGIRGVSEIDQNGDGFITFEELTATYPDVSDADFAEMDSNGDSRLDFTELYSLDSQNILARHMS
jgi:Ca2+-binding EF-hand superfamily protein